MSVNHFESGVAGLSVLGRICLSDEGYASSVEMKRLCNIHTSEISRLLGRYVNASLYVHIDLLALQ